MLGRHRAALRTLKGIFIDCGWRDQFNIHYGARRLSAESNKAGITHVHEKFDGTQSGIDYRMDRSLPFHYRALKPGGVRQTQRYGPLWHLYVFLPLLDLESRGLSQIPRRNDPPQD